jgi:hypothetical protein
VTTGEPQYDAQGSTNIPPSYSHDDTSTDTGSSATQQLADKAQQGADQVKQTVSSAADKAKQTAKSQASTQKDQAAQGLHTVGQAVNQAAQQLRQNNQAPIAQVAETAASNLNQFADHLSSRNIDDLIGEVENFASSQPALFLGGAFLLGVLGARFLKSSRSGMSQSGSGSQQWRGQPGWQQGQQQNWSGPNSGYATQGRYGSRYSAYGDPTYPNPPGRGDNINTGGLAYGRNLPTDSSAQAQSRARRVNGTYETYPSDDDIVAGETPR